MQKVIMIIGAGKGQLPAIMTAKKMGFRVIAVDKSPAAEGMAFADVALPVDFINIPAVLEKAREHNVSAVVTMQSDLPVYTSGAIVDELGLPGIGYNVARRCINKLEMHECLSKNGVPTPRFAAVNSIEEAKAALKEIGLPCIIKPADGSGSRGVSKIADIDMLESAFKETIAQSKNGKMCIEEFIDGVEIGAQAFSRGGHCRMVLVHNDTVSPAPYFVPVGHSFPSKLGKAQLESIEKMVMTAVDTLGIHTGPSNIDMILNGNGEPVIIDVGARVGATCLPELVSHFTGIDWVEATIEAAMGKAPSLGQSRHRPCAAAIIESSRDGILKAFRIPKELSDLDGVLEIKMEAAVGQEVYKLRNGTNRIGKILVEGESWQKAEEKAEWIKSRISLDVV